MFVWCLCGVCEVFVRCLCGVCEVTCGVVTYAGCRWALSRQTAGNCVFVWCLCGVCVVFVRCLCGVCEVFVRCL